MRVKLLIFTCFIGLVMGGLLSTGCQPNMDENQKFDKFAQQYEKMASKVFPATTPEPATDTLAVTLLNKQEVLRKVEFCRENLDQLANFDLQKLNAENTERLKTIFAALKQHLSELEEAAKTLTE